LVKLKEKEFEEYQEFGFRRKRPPAVNVDGKSAQPWSAIYPRLGSSKT
jgi:hypothetical protein